MTRRLCSWAGIAAMTASVLWLMQPVAGGQGRQAPTAQEIAARAQVESVKPTPRAADGHPDLTGYWGDVPGPGLGYVRDGKKLTVIELDAPELDETGQPRAKARMADRSRRPPYKPH